MSRDQQRGRLYAAEDIVASMLANAARGAKTIEIAGSTVTLPVERKFASIESIQAYCDQVLALNWVVAKWGDRGPVRVRERAGHTSAHYERGPRVIAIPPHAQGEAWAMREMIVLHELAHHLCPASGHGPVFAELFLDLVDGIIGPEVGFALRVTYHDHNVSTKRPS